MLLAFNLLTKMDSLVVRGIACPAQAGDLGTVQVPGDCQPIIQMADRQTSGSYARIANLITVDLTFLAQMRLGDRMRLRDKTLGIAPHLYIIQKA